jgi:hypothetical protein
LAKRRINICKPGFGASCALCCGSHNFNLPLEKIEILLQGRMRDSSALYYKHPHESLFEKRFSDGMQCPNVAMDEENELFCLIYNDPFKSAEVNSFFNGTCKNFYCPAWDYLSDEEVIFAAKLMSDWYYYGLLINNIEGLKELFAQYIDLAMVPYEELENIKQELHDMVFDF